ncbi:hypothetical protein FKM82_003546 [Ascaphus truei]
MPRKRMRRSADGKRRAKRDQKYAEVGVAGKPPKLMPGVSLQNRLAFARRKPRDWRPLDLERDVHHLSRP